VIASFGVHVWQGAVHFSASGAVQLAALPGSWWVAHSLFHSLPWRTCAILCMRPLSYCVWAVRQGLRADGVCGVLAPPHACHARCRVSFGIQHVSSSCACVVHVMWDCNNYSAAVHCMLLRPRGPLISFSVLFHCAVLGLAELQVRWIVARFGPH
jgi:hypothetical protein